MAISFILHSTLDNNGFPFVITEIVASYVESSDQVFSSVSQQRSLFCTISLLFLSIITFGAWNWMQTSRFLQGVDQLIGTKANSKGATDLAAQLRAIEEMSKAVLWGADLSQAIRYDFSKLVDSPNGKMFLCFLAGQINKELGENDPILQQFCHTLSTYMESTAKDANEFWDNNYHGNRNAYNSNPYTGEMSRFTLLNSADKSCDKYAYLLDILKSHLKEQKNYAYPYIELSNPLIRLLDPDTGEKAKHGEGNFDYAVDAFKARTRS